MDKKLIEDYEEFFNKISKEKTVLIDDENKPGRFKTPENKIEWVQKYIDNIFKIELIEKTYSIEFAEYMRKFRGR